jgi:hypothetical protein
MLQNIIYQTLWQATIASIPGKRSIPTTIEPKPFVMKSLQQHLSKKPTV